MAEVKYRVKKSAPIVVDGYIEAQAIEGDTWVLVSEDEEQDVIIVKNCYGDEMGVPREQFVKFFEMI